ncbi:MAG: indole-3-glycerol phosphate synthase TrpC [Candidatus Binatia bacterium]
MFLDEIARHVRSEVETRRQQIPAAALKDRPLFHVARRKFVARLQEKGRHIIAEVKRASPSQGLIRADFDPVNIARRYADNGASALSVLTEERFFQGCLSYLEEIRSAVSLPLLRKDFIFDRYQLLEARSYGADAILLIVAILSPAQLRELREEAQELEMDSLVEAHTEEELEQALSSGARIVGINNRDLRTFAVNLATTERLAPRVPPEVVVVCESGLESAAQIQRIEKVGVHAFLIGETLMRAADPGVKLTELLS